MFSFKCSLLPIVLLMAVVSAARPAAGESLLINNARVISGEHAVAGPPQDVLIRNGFIERIGRIRAGADQTIDAAGAYLIPGLIDTHVHLGEIPGDAPGAGIPESVAAEARAQIPRSYLYFGFTTLLDLANDAGPIAQWNARPVAPRAFHCVAITVPGGYPLAFLDSDTQAMPQLTNFLLFDESLAASWPANLAKDEHRPAALVARAVKEGADCIKTMYETGFGPKKNLPVPSLAAVQMLVEAAHAAKLTVYIHANSESAHRFAMAAGADVIAHGLWNSDSNDEVLAGITAAIREKGIAVQPTIQVLIGERELFNRDFLDDEHARAVIPASLSNWYRSEPGQWMKRRMRENFGGQDHGEDFYGTARARYAQIEQRVLNMIRALSGGDHPALRFGSDTPSGPFYTQFPGLNGYREIRSWAEAGVAPAGIFRALTVDNAKLLGMEKQIGAVEVGMRADLLILKQNPLVSVGAYDSIDTVVLNGKAIARRSLRAGN